MRLARQSREDSWFQHYDLQHPTYIGLEASAASIADYKSDVINGLLQTERYARAILEATLPDPTEDKIAQNVKSRELRQRLLTDDPPLGLWAVIHEAALRTYIGGPEVMREQLETLVDRPPSRTSTCTAAVSRPAPTRPSTAPSPFCTSAKMCPTSSTSRAC